MYSHLKTGTIYLLLLFFLQMQYEDSFLCQCCQQYRIPKLPYFKIHRNIRFYLNKEVAVPRIIVHIWIETMLSPRCNLKDIITVSMFGIQFPTHISSLCSVRATCKSVYDYTLQKLRYICFNPLTLLVNYQTIRIYQCGTFHNRSSSLYLYLHPFMSSPI